MDNRLPLRVVLDPIARRPDPWLELRDAVTRAGLSMDELNAWIAVISTSRQVHTHDHVHGHVHWHLSRGRGARLLDAIYAGPVDIATARCAALIAAAIARAGQRATPADLMTDAAPLIPWILVAATHMTLTIQGDSMPLTVDSANAVAILSFTDDHNDAVAPPAGTLATAVSSDTAVMTVGTAVAGADANGVPNIQFPLTEVTAGSSTLSVTATDPNGNPLLGPDGATPIPAPAPVVVNVAPGAAADEVFTVPGN